MMSKAWHRALCAGLAVMLLWVAASPALPAAETDAGWHTFWSVKGRHGNTLWLLGSVHLLRPDESLPPRDVLQAYAGSKRLVLELALDCGRRTVAQWREFSGAWDDGVFR